MIVEGLTALPKWLVLGVFLGFLGSVGVVGAFVLADRYFPVDRSVRTSGDGESRRRREFRDYLDALQEPYAEGHVVEGQHVAFYLPERDVAITFDPRAYYRILRSETEPVLVEHEMPGRVLGTRLPFETPAVDFGDSGVADPAPVRAAFAELDLSIDARTGEVTRAYRRRVVDAHPDQGGSEEEFKRLREAYAIAKKHVESG